MNKTRSCLLLLGLSLFLNLHLISNDLVKFPTGRAEWTVDVSDSIIGKTSLGGSAVSKVEVSQNEQISSNLVTYFNGKSRVSYNITGTNLILTEDPAGTAFLTPSSNFFFIPYLPSVFDWLTPELLQEKDPISYQEKLCFHYKGPKAEAWIDSKTLLPVALDDGTALATFTFQPTPAAPLIVPEKFKKVLDGYIAVMGIHRSE